jgi:hypothetical protein
MPSANRRPDPAAGSAEQGSAAVEFLTLGVLLLVPLVYLVLTLGALQGAAFAAEGAARQAARTLVLAATDAQGRAAAAASAQEGLADWRIAPTAARIEVRCAPAPEDCLRVRGRVRVTVRIAVALPLLPPALAVDAPGSVAIEGHAVQSVSMFQAPG